MLSTSTDNRGSFVGAESKPPIRADASVMPKFGSDDTISNGTMEFGGITSIAG